MNPLGPNNPSTFTSIGRGFTQLAAGARDLFRGAYTAVGRWLAGAPAQQRAGPQTEMTRREAFEVPAQKDPRGEAQIPPLVVVTPGTVASADGPGPTAVMRADFLREGGSDSDDDAARSTPTASTTAIGPALQSPAASPSKSLDAAAPLAPHLQQAAADVSEWLDANQPTTANSGTSLFRNADAASMAIKKVVVPAFGPVVGRLARDIVKDVVRETARASKTGILSKRELTRTEQDAILLACVQRRFVGPAGQNLLAELVPKDIQAFLRTVHTAIEQWHPASADNVLPSSLFLKCASSTLGDLAHGAKKAEQTHFANLSRLLLNLVTSTQSLRDTKAKASGASPADPAKARYDQAFVAASDKLKADMRALVG